MVVHPHLREEERGLAEDDLALLELAAFLQAEVHSNLYHRCAPHSAQLQVPTLSHYYEVFG